MGLARWFTSNVCDTALGTHPDTGPLRLTVEPAAALTMIEQVIRQRRGWSVVSVDPATATIHATRRTSVFRFVDDVHVRVESSNAGWLVQARSESRVGKGDLGQNRRNVRDLFRAIRKSAGRT